MTTAIRGLTNTGQVDAGPSRLLWKDCPWESIGSPGCEGVKFEEDFSDYPSWATLTNPIIAAASQINPFKYSTYFDTGDTIKMSATDPFGALAMVTAATDNNEVWQQPGGNAGGSFVLIDPAVSAQHELWYEARFKIASISANISSLFFGFGEEGMAVADTKINDTGAMVDKDFIGFNTLHGAAAENAQLAFTFKKFGQTVQVPIATVATLVADTFISVGFHYLTSNPTARRIMVFKNNVALATGVTKAAIELATFPAAEEMNPLWGHKNGSAGAGTLTVQWIRAAMVKN